MTELTVGYVGLGAMGGALARRLMLSRSLHVYDIRPQARIEFAEAGAVAAPDLPSLARACDVIFTCVPTSAHVRQAVLGEGGLAEGLSPGKLVVDQTTGDAIQTRVLAAELLERGVTLLDAPVSGGTRGAIAGTIGIFCGGPRDGYERVRPVLESISPNIAYCGGVGNGHASKLINNAVASCNRAITYEAASVAVKYGLPLELVARVILKSTGWNDGASRILPSLSQGGQTTQFRLELMVKDLRLATQMGMACGAPMLVANQVRNLFEAGINQVGGEANLDDVARVFESLAGIRFAGS